MSRRKKGRKRNRINLGLYSLFFRILQMTLGLFLLRRWNVQAINRKLLFRLKPPYFIMPNHVSFWDPFIVASYVPHPVFYVTSDAQFRSPLLRRALALVGAIPKTKARSDTETIRTILSLRSQGAVVGIFPEGVRTWDGHSLPIIPATAKLVKLAKIPVVVPRIQGGFLSDPRWARNGRRGHIVIDYRLAVDADEAKRLSVEEIQRRIDEAIAYDSYEYQLEHREPFRGRHLAENVEKALFICPRCRSIGTLRSKNELLTCQECGYAVEYSAYGFLDKRSREFYFSSLHEWNQWQLAELKARIVELRKDRDGQGGPLFEDRRVWLWMGMRRMPIERFRIGRLSLYGDRVEFRSWRGLVISWPLADIEGINVQNKEHLEFFVGKRLLHFRFRRKFDSSYKWQEAVRMAQAMGRPEAGGSDAVPREPLAALS